MSGQRRRTGLAVRAVLALTLSAITGCGGPKPVTGGTRGLLHVRNGAVTDIQVAVYRHGSNEPFGVGVSGGDGWFELRNKSASEAVLLQPGEYRVTFESVGPVALRIPAEYGRPETTALNLTWSEGQQVLELELPAAP
ncbi:hypothetical protein [Planctellipticum variicoloris]|uniref:hypothetical protein n=1 Tax=Planctellipticum variicoloris TaxID=3064265 RepID=UPI003013CFFD|nr:hypothetical protein SH412_001895 [Planctomycetaceae bacterium SH412]